MPSIVTREDRARPIRLIPIFWTTTQRNEEDDKKSDRHHDDLTDAGDIRIVAGHMRKILFLLILLLLSACQKSEEDQLAELGYLQEDIVLIQGLSEENKGLFLNEMNETALSYLQVSLYSSPFFIKEKEETYLKYLNTYSDTREMIEIVNTLRYKELFTDIVPTDMSKGDLILVNKYHILSSDYEPEDLVQIESDYGSGRLREKAYEAYKKLCDKAREEGYPLRVVSSYRSYAYQEGLYNKYLGRDSKENVDTYSARPGHSEHQTGMAIDVSLPGVSLDDFGKTEAARWLNEHCMEYGFIVRYPKDKIGITGYIEEPWHIRYLGVDIAKDVYAKGITYDEYYACYIE